MTEKRGMEISCDGLEVWRCDVTGERYGDFM